MYGIKIRKNLYWTIMCSHRSDKTKFTSPVFFYRSALLVITKIDRIVYLTGTVCSRLHSTDRNIFFQAQSDFIACIVYQWFVVVLDNFLYIMKPNTDKPVFFCFVFSAVCFSAEREWTNAAYVSFRDSFTNASRWLP